MNREIEIENDIESNTTEESPVAENKTHYYFKIYFGIIVSLFVGILIYGWIGGDQYSSKQINTFYIVFISLSLFPMILYLFYLTCKWDRCYCVI